MPNGPVFECHLKTGQPNHFNNGQMDAILFSYVMVWYLNGQSSTKDIARRPTISGMQMVDIQIPTELDKSEFEWSNNDKTSRVER